MAHKIAEVAGTWQSVIIDTIREGNEAARQIPLLHAQDALAQGAVTDSQIQILTDNGLGGEVYINMARNWTR